MNLVPRLFFEANFVGKRREIQGQYALCSQNRCFACRCFPKGGVENL